VGGLGLGLGLGYPNPNPPLLTRLSRVVVLGCAALGRAAGEAHRCSAARYAVMSDVDCHISFVQCVPSPC